MRARVDYYKYIASREWKLKCRAVKERSGGVCERCHYGPHENTHHVTYERLGNERLDDLLGLCRPCHEYESGVSDFDPVEARKPKELVVRIDFSGDDKDRDALAADLFPMLNRCRKSSGQRVVFIVDFSTQKGCEVRPNVDVRIDGKLLAREVSSSFIAWMFVSVDSNSIQSDPILQVGHPMAGVRMFKAVTQ